MSRLVTVFRPLWFAKYFELSNHLGNVLVTISDKKTGIDTDTDGDVDYYTSDVVTATDYYPFGMQMVGRKFDAGKYRYGFNGKENDNDVKGTGAQYDYGFRIYDPRLGKFLSVDPLASEFPWNGTYSFAENDVLRCVDLDGLEKYFTISGQYLGLNTNGDNGQLKLATSVEVVCDLNTNRELLMAKGVKTLNSEKTLLGRNESGRQITGISVLTNTELQDLLAYSTFVIDGLYNSNLENAVISESNAGPFKEPTNMLDFKSKLYELFEFGENDLIEVDGVLYNANEAGNFVWGMVLERLGFLPVSANKLAEIGTVGRPDEPHDQKAITAGRKKADEVNMPSNQKEIFDWFMSDYQLKKEENGGEDPLTYSAPSYLKYLKTQREKPLPPDTLTPPDTTRQ